MYLSADPAKLKNLYGIDAQQSLLFSAIRLDSHPLVAPIIAEWDDHDPILLARQQEQGNILSAGVSPADIRFYAPWVTIDPTPIEGFDAADSLAGLVQELAAGAKVTLGAEIVYAHYLALQDVVEIAVEAAPAAEVTLVELDKDSILERFASWRESGIPEAKKLIAGIAHLEGLEREIVDTGADSRFIALADITTAEGLSGIFISSPPNFSELTGIAATPGASALWSAADDKVYLFLPQGSELPAAAVEKGNYTSVAAAVAALGITGRLGIEEDFIGSALALSFQDHQLVPTQMSLGNWRDIRDREDLPFQVIAARTSVSIIEDALAWADARIEQGDEFSELDIYEHYLACLEDFTRDLPFEVVPYFTNLHSSNRMLFPGPPVDFPINAETRCIQLDAGVAVKIDGVVLATSDMARSLPRTDAAREAYEYFFEVVREGIIAQLRPGTVCSAVHEATLDYVAPKLDRMIEIGMLGADTDFNGIYRKRNVGHLMGKQESFANELRPGYDHILTEGSYGAAEIPWRYNGVAIGTEDLWYIGADKTYILSQR